MLSILDFIVYLSKNNKELKKDPSCCLKLMNIKKYRIIHEKISRMFHYHLMLNNMQQLKLFKMIKRYLFNLIKIKLNIEDDDEILVYEYLKEKYPNYEELFIPKSHLYVAKHLINLLGADHSDLGIDFRSGFSDFIEKNNMVVVYEDVSILDSDESIINYLTFGVVNRFQMLILYTALFDKIIDFFLYLNNEQKILRQNIL